MKVKAARQCGRLMLVNVLVAGGLFATVTGPAGSLGVARASDAVDDAATAPTAATASEIADEYRHDVVIDDKTTETTQVVAKPDGSFQATEWSDPVRVPRVDKWVPIDTELSVTSTGRLVPAATATPVSFSAGGAGPLATITTDAGSAIAVSWHQGDLPAPSIDGDSATYADVLPGVDLSVTATATGMAEVLIVSDAAAASQPGLSDLAFDIAGATLRDSTGGTTLATTTAGEQFVSPTPTWWDSRDGGSPHAPGVKGVPVPFDAEVTAAREMLPIADVLSGATVMYPAYIDPDFSDSQQGRTFVDTAYPDTSYWNGAGASDAYQHVGYIDAANSDDGRAHTTRSFWQMKTNLYAGRSIVSADFNASLIYSSSCTHTRVNLQSAGAISTGTTWNNKPGPTAQQSFIDDAAGYSSNCVGKTVTFSATQAVTAAAASDASSIVLMLAADSETDWHGWKKFGANVSLIVNYHTVPSVPRVWDTGCHRSPGLAEGDRLLPGQSRFSLDGDFSLTMQTDGNLVERQTISAFVVGGTAKWTTGTNSAANAGAYVIMQSDGNLVVDRPNGGGAAWSSGVSAGNRLVIQEAGNLVIYDPQQVATWHTGSVVTSSVPFSCYSNVTPNHTFAAVSTDVDINQQSAITYHFDLRWNQSTDKPSVNANSGATAQFVYPAFGDAAYTFRAQACVRDAPTVCSAWSAWAKTIQDTVAPAPLVLSVDDPNTADVSTDPSSHRGRVGADHDTVKIAPASASDGVFGYVYGVSDGSDPVNAVADTTFPANDIGCANTSAGFIEVCDPGVNQPMTLDVSPIDNASHLTVLPFDMAGNEPVTRQKAADGQTFLSFYAFADTPNVRAGHSWATGAGDQGPTATTGCPHDAVPDTATAAVSATAAALSATGVCWQPASTHPDPTGYPHNVLAFTGGSAATSGAVVDAASTFSVGAWVHPTRSGASYVDTVVSGTAAHGSVFQLQNAAGHWRFCVANADTATFSGNCAVGAAVAVSDQWVFVSATYDAINHQLRLWTSTDGSRPTATQSDDQMVAAPHLYASGATEDARIVQGATMTPNNTVSNTWNGQLSNVFVVQAALSIWEFENLGQHYKSPSAEPTQG